MPIPSFKDEHLLQRVRRQGLEEARDSFDLQLMDLEKSLLMKDDSHEQHEAVKSTTKLTKSLMVLLDRQKRETRLGIHRLIHF